MYSIILHRRDNFILAAINANDPKMKTLWLKRAMAMNIMLQLYSNYTVGDFK